MKNDNNLENMGSIPDEKSGTPATPLSKKSVKKESIIILRIQSAFTDDDREELEKKYSKKFGCKVVILAGNLQYVDIIDG